MKIGLLVAMQSEKNQVLNFLHVQKETTIGHLTFYECKCGGNRIILAESGIGKVNATITCTEMIQHYKPDCIISTGLSGGIDASLQIMDTVIGERVVYHDVNCVDLGCEYGQMCGLPLYFHSDERLLNFTNLLSNREHLHKGLICSGDQFISAEEDIKKIKSKFPEGLASEMESGAIGHVCYLYKVPYICFRVISDIPGAENQVADYADFIKSMTSASFKIIKEYLIKIPSTLA